MANNNAATTNEIKAKIPKHREFTILHEAVLNEQALPKVMASIKRGELEVDVSGANERNETPLHYAMYHKKIYAIEPLIDAGAKVNKRTIGGDTPLSLGVQANGAAAVKNLIDVCKAKGINLDLNKGNLFGETPLHWACCYGRVAIVRLLVEAGANMDSQTVTGETPLFMAITNKQNDCVEFLKSKGATAPEPTKPAPVPVTLPSPITEGYLMNEWEHEMKFGGALWGKGLEFFYFGKKPRPGFAVSISVAFSAPIKGKKGTIFWGFIRSVADDKRSFEATVKLNVDAREVLTDLNKDWNAKIHFDSSKQNPWVLVSLTPIDTQANPDQAWEKVMETSLELEAKYGRSITREPQGAFADMGHDDDHGHGHSHQHGEECNHGHGGHDHGHSHGHGEECNDNDHSHSHQHGEECDHDDEEEHGGHSHSHGGHDHGGHSHSHDHGGHGHSHGHGGPRELPAEAHWLLKTDVKPGMDTTNIKVITGFHIENLMTVEYTFLDGTKQTVRDPQKAPFLIQMMIMKNEQAASEGRGRVPLSFSQEFRQFAISMNMLSEDDINEMEQS